jgi:hypothetical protein
VHTTSYTFAFLLHHLACTPRVQELLHEEVLTLHQEVAGCKEEKLWMTRDLLARAVYAKACLRQRETHNETLSSNHFKGEVQLDFSSTSGFS